jgi:uncharacterized protein (DUF1499 family)
VRRRVAIPEAARRLALAAALAAQVACASAKPAPLGIRYDRLAPCPTAPKCVSSDALDPSHRVAAFEFRVPPAEAWWAAREAVAALAATRIVAADDAYLHAITTRGMGAVDDLELHLRPERNLIAVRSGARDGYTDFGANRRRVEALRADLVGRGVVAP